MTVSKAASQWPRVGQLLCIVTAMGALTLTSYVRLSRTPDAQQLREEDVHPHAPAADLDMWRVPHYGQGSAPVVRVRPDGAMVAMLGDDMRMQVWELGADASLEALLRDTKGDEYIVLSVGWVGRRLAYWRVNGITSYRGFLRAVDDPLGRNPYGDPHDFIADNSETCLWDPTTNQEAVLPGGGILAGDASGSQLVTLAGTLDGDLVGDSVEHLAIRTTAAGEGELVDRFAAVTGRRLHPVYAFSEVLVSPFLADGEARPFLFVVGRTDGFMMPGDRWSVPVPALVLVGLDGQVTCATNGTTNRLMTHLPGLPALVDLGSDGVAVACMLRKWESLPPRLAYYGPDGRVLREYGFGLKWGVVERGTGEKVNWRPVAVTPSGTHLLIHDTGDELQVPPYAKRWLWSWDLERKAGVRLLRLPDVEMAYGWVNDEHLILAVSDPIAGADGTPLPRYRLRVLHLPDLETR